MPPLAPPLPLDVLFEDDHLLAISKAAGMVAHPCYRHPDGTVFDALLAHLGGTGIRPHLLQRLDKGTSGVMLASKTMTAHAAVVRAMARRSGGGVRKEYLAVVHGAPEPASGEIALRLRRDPADSRRVAASDTEGKESVTRYTVMASSLSDRRGMAGSSEPEAGTLLASLVLCQPLTGRMHQIRVHLAARGWPIVGDPVYGEAQAPSPSRASTPKPEACDTSERSAAGTGIDRQALHAWRVSLAHPVTGAPLVITAPIPSDVAALLDHLGLAGCVP
jgi:23S rRNA pseudouridine1911/1915/1917 synthase